VTRQKGQRNYQFKTKAKKGRENIEKKGDLPQQRRDGNRKGECSRQSVWGGSRIVPCSLGAARKKESEIQEANPKINMPFLTFELNRVESKIIIVRRTR